MKLPTSDKVGKSFGKKPHIKKGYYPGQLISVEIFKDKNGLPKIGKYGRQLILGFNVFSKDNETDAPIKQITYKSDEGEETPVVISKFVYHEYKRIAPGKEWVEGEYQTAITPKSAITKILEALGWTFSGKGVDPEEFLYNWVELNIDDYTQGEGNEAYTASTIKDINPYKGPEVKEIGLKKSNAPKKESKEDSDNTEEIAKLEEQIRKLDSLFEGGSLTEEGHSQAIEQLKTKIEGLRR